MNPHWPQCSICCSSKQFPSGLGWLGQGLSSSPRQVKAYIDANVNEVNNDTTLGQLLAIVDHKLSVYQGFEPNEESLACWAETECTVRADAEVYAKVTHEEGMVDSTPRWVYVGSATSVYGALESRMTTHGGPGRKA